MEVGKRGGGRNSSNVVAGSVWEGRMKVDEVKGGIKVFNGEEVDGNGDGGGKVKRVLSAGMNGKRKTWKSESFDGNPIRIGKGKSDEQMKELKSPVGRKLRSEGSPKKIRKVRSELGKDNGESGRRKVQSPEGKVAGEQMGKNSDAIEGLDESVHEIEKTPIEIQDSGSDETCKEFGVCEEKFISSSKTDMGLIQSAPKIDDNDDDDDDDEEEDECEEAEIKEINIPEQKPMKSVNEEKKFHQISPKKEPISVTVKKQSSPVTKPSTTFHQKNPKPNRIPVADETQNFPATQNKLESLVDLVMWRDISRSAFVFGFGTFTIISSSYTKDLNISFISVISYLGLVYLAAIFLYRSIICRGIIDVDNTSYVLGEDEGIWLMKLILPYLNEFLLNLKALFSGDPATTIKLAVVLFVLARCGSSITIWKMARLGFFGVFTVPKICSSYSTQLSAYGKFWMRRFHDAWESCSHKKGVAAAIFTLVWNLSSIVARIWAVFILFVAVRYYQQNLVSDEWIDEDDPMGDETVKGEGAVQGHGRALTIAELNKSKKGA